MDLCDSICEFGANVRSTLSTTRWVFVTDLVNMEMILNESTVSGVRNLIPTEIPRNNFGTVVSYKSIRKLINVTNDSASNIIERLNHYMSVFTATNTEHEFMKYEVRVLELK